MDEIARLCSRSGVSINSALKMIGIGKSRYFDWKTRYGQSNRHNGLIPKDSWVLPEEKKSIIEYYAKNPRNGCKRLSYMMIDEDVAYVSHSTVHRVLKDEGLLESSKNSPGLKGKGFDQPSGPHRRWHINISYVNAGDTFYYLCSILDGYSRFIVHWELKESMKQEDCQLVIQRAKEKTGVDRVRVISDNGPQFKARRFKEFMNSAGMDQTFTSPYYPQSNGKSERWHKEMKQSCIRASQARNLKEANSFLSEFIEEYNYKRLHGAIGYVTPYDRLLGIDHELKQNRKIKLEKARNRRKNAWIKLRRENESTDNTTKPDRCMEPPLTPGEGG